MFALQNIDKYFFAFPLNVLFAAIWVIVVYLLYNRFSKSAFVKFMLSPIATIASLGMFAAACIVVGLTGKRELVSSWIFAFIIFFLLTVLMFVLMRGWRRQMPDGTVFIRWRFILLHVGLLLALGSGFWGAPDSQTLRLQVFEGIPVKEAFFMNGESVWLPYEINLKSVEIDTWENGVPSYTAADIVIDGHEARVAVNHPYSRSFGEDVYITAYGGNTDGEVPYCILQIVREPWKYVMATGILMLLAGALLLFLNGPQRTTTKEA